MFGMGLQEILLIAVIGIVVIGPDQLPSVARAIGRMLAQFKRASNDLRHAVSDEMQQHEELNQFKEFQRELDGGVREIGEGAQAFIDREVEKGERELEEFERQAAEVGDAAGEEATEYVPSLGDHPLDEAAAEAIESAGAVTAEDAGGGSDEVSNPDSGANSDDEAVAAEGAAEEADAAAATEGAAAAKDGAANDSDTDSGTDSDAAAHKEFA